MRVRRQHQRSAWPADEHLVAGLRLLGPGGGHPFTVQYEVDHQLSVADPFKRANSQLSNAWSGDWEWLARLREEDPQVVVCRQRAEPDQVWPFDTTRRYAGVIWWTWRTCTGAGGVPAVGG